MLSFTIQIISDFLKFTAPSEDNALPTQQLRKYQLPQTLRVNFSDEHQTIHEHNLNVNKDHLVPKEDFIMELKTQDEANARNIRETTRDGIGAKCASGFERIQNSISGFYTRHKSKFKLILYTILLLLYGAYLAAALYFNPKRSLAVCIISAVIIFFWVYSVVQGPLFRLLNHFCYRPLAKLFKKCGRKSTYIKW